MGGEKLKTSFCALHGKAVLYGMTALRRLAVLLLLGAGLFIQIQQISAQEESSPVEDPLRAAEQAFTFEESPSITAAASESSIWAAVRMILVLAMAAAAVYGVVFFIKRSSRRTVTSDPFLKVLASSPLGSNRYAHIVAVGSKAWLLGSGDGGVNLIGEIDDKDIINAMLLEDSKKGAETPGRIPDFLSILRRMGAQAESRTPGAEEIRKRRERLKRL
ncbi:MAG: flagellar biosynthetic protein FliO [Treponema sp.]|nr:flagellar biosynthetic protein FliO [Treponema sp.]